MSRYKPDRFNFSHMSERLKFQVQQPDGKYKDDLTVWAHVLKDGFIRSETDNWYKIMIREQTALDSLLSVGNRMIWKNRVLSIFSWQDPSIEKRGFIEILAKQIITSTGVNPGPSENDFFGDFVSVYRMITTPVTEYGLTTYKYTYNFDTPTFSGIRCRFSTDRNRYLEDKRIDIEHDALVILFSKDAPIKIEDYLISPIHGKYKVDMVTLNADDMLEVSVKRGEHQ